MAQVQSDVMPSILAAPDRPNVYQDVSAATPNAFGAQIGQSEQSLGSNLNLAGQNFADVANARQQLINQAAATSGSVDFAQKLADAQSAYKSLQGSDAVNGYDAFQQNVKDLRDAAIGSMSNPVAQQMLSSDVNRRVSMAFEDAASWRAQNIKQWDSDSSKARAAVNVNAATAAYNNPAQVNEFWKAGLAEVDRQAAIHGWSPDVTAANKAAYSGTLFGGVITAKAQDDPLAAQAMLAQVRPLLDADTQNRLAELLKPKVANAVADQRLASITGTAAPILGRPDVDTLWNAVKVQESGGKQFAPGTTEPLMSPKGAIGISQIMPGTAQEIANDRGEPLDMDRLQHDAAYNERYGRQYFSKMLGMFGDPNAAAAAYNAGPGAVKQAQGQYGADWLNHMPAETQKYVKSIGAHINAQSGQGDGGSNILANYEDDMRQALDMTQNDPEGREILVSKLNAQYHQQQSIVEQQKATLKQNLDALQPQLLNGTDGLVIPETDIHRLYPGPQGDAMVANLNLTQVAGRVMKSMALATPEDVANYQTQLGPNGQGPVLDMLRQKAGVQLDPTTGQPIDQVNMVADANARQYVSGAIGKLIQSRTDALAKDAASYVLQNDPAVAAAAQDYAASKGDPDKFNTYATASLASQARLGVPSYQQSILTAPQIAAISKALTSADPSKIDVGQEVDSLRKQYGQQWPQVFGELVTKGNLPREFQAVATMSQPSQVFARADMSRAVQLAAQKGGPAAIEELAGKDNMQAITAGLAATMKPFTSTAVVPGTPGSPQMAADATASVKQLATYYAATQNMNGAQALKKAYDGIIGLRYDTGAGTFRAPMVNGVSMLPQVQSAIGQVQSSLKPEDLKDPGFKPGEPAGDLTPQQRAANILSAPAVWVNNELDNGIIMTARTKDGALIPVRRADGSRVELKFSDIARNSPTSDITKAPDNSYQFVGGF